MVSVTAQHLWSWPAVQPWSPRRRARSWCPTVPELVPSTRTPRSRRRRSGRPPPRAPSSDHHRHVAEARPEGGELAHGEGLVTPDTHVVERDGLGRVIDADDGDRVLSESVRHRASVPRAPG